MKQYARLLGMLLVMVFLLCGCSGVGQPMETTLPTEPPLPPDAPLVQDISTYLNGRMPSYVSTGTDGTLTMYFDLYTGDELLFIQYITAHVNEDSPFRLLGLGSDQVYSGSTECFKLRYTGSQPVGTIVSDTGSECHVLLDILPEQEGRQAQVRVSYAEGLIHRDVGIRVDESIVYKIVPDICAFLDGHDITFSVTPSGDYTLTIFYFNAESEKLIQEYMDLLTGNIYGFRIAEQKTEKHESWTSWGYTLEHPHAAQASEDCFLGYEIAIGYRIPDDGSDGLCFIMHDNGLLMMDTGHRSTTALTAPVPDICSFLDGYAPTTDTRLDNGIRKLEFKLEPGDEALVAQYLDHLKASGSEYILLDTKDDSSSATKLVHYYLGYTGKSMITDMTIGDDKRCDVYLGLRSRHDLSEVYLLVYYNEGLVPTDDGARADTSKAGTPITDISTFLNNRTPKTQETLTHGSTRLKFTMSAGEHVLSEQYINSIISSENLTIRETVTEDAKHSTLTHYLIDYTGNHEMMNLQMTFPDGSVKTCNLYICVEKSKGNSDGCLTLIYPKQFQRQDTGSKADFSKVVKPSTTGSGSSGSSGGSGGTKDVLEREDCYACYRGRCRKCGGSGYYYKYLPGERKQVMQNCTKCVGGSCPTCGGSGWL